MSEPYAFALYIVSLLALGAYCWGTDSDVV